jgi:hypothetical protein
MRTQPLSRSGIRGKRSLLLPVLLLLAVPGFAQSIRYKQTNKETEYHYGIIADADMERITEIEKIQHEFRTIERTVTKTIDDSHRMLLDISIDHNDYEQSWMKLAARFKYGPHDVELYNKAGEFMRKNPYTEQEIERNAIIRNSIQESGYHPGLATFPKLTAEAEAFYAEQGISVDASEDGDYLKLLYPDGRKEVFDAVNLTTQREWIDAEGIRTVETKGYEPYMINKGYLPSIRKTERFIQSVNGPCITEVRMIHYKDYHIEDHALYIDKATERTESVTVYPNPNEGIFSVAVQTIDNEPITGCLIVNTLTGKQLVVNPANEHSFSADISGEPGGHYVIRVFTNHSSLSFPFFKK